MSLRGILALGVAVVSVTLMTGSASAVSPAYTLQILHLYGETGTIADQTAPIMGAMVDTFRPSIRTR